MEKSTNPLKLSPKEEATQIMVKFRRDADAIIEILNDKGFQKQFKKLHKR
jgi:hypothetical protein